ncbi:unnamed protein product [Urochloa decumbens]|uniref:F-box domain-containing protein n=1 Tax=Urochloa decumbens TaxID=240449 RepID=A0ABC9E2B4_9POAL
MAIDAAAGGGGEKKQRVDGQGDPSESVGADAIPADPISALPDELRQRILTHLPLKDAVRTGPVARGWRDLWRCRWAHRGSVELHLRSRDAPRIELDALECEPRPRRRLDRFSLVVDTCKLKSSELRRFIEYAAECRVEDLHVEVRKTTAAEKLNFHLPLASPLLARLSLRRISISNMYYKGAQPFHALEVILLHSVSIAQVTFYRMMELCPNLLTLDLRGCDCEHLFFWGRAMDWPAKLRSVTVAECDGTIKLDLVRVRSLRSFRYSCGFLDIPFSLAGDAVLSDLYIRFLYSSVTVSRRAQEFNKGLPNDLSALTVLTICNNALLVASSSYDDGGTAQLPKLSNLHGLRELHLLMLKMEYANLADIYLFLKTCKCHSLERLFVQLPGFVYKSMESSLDVVPEEPPEDGLDNLAMVKVMNFNWCWAEVQLVSFLLRKAKSLQKLLVVSPNVTPPDVPGVQDEDLLFLKEALANGKIMLSESDDAATQPYHSEVFIESSCQSPVGLEPYG